MPVEVVVEYMDGKKEKYYIPLRIMRGVKPDDKEMPRKVLEDWPWTYPTYTFSIPGFADNIRKVEIDPSMRMADIDRSNNVIDIEEKDSTFE